MEPQNSRMIGEPYSRLTGSFVELWPDSPVFSYTPKELRLRSGTIKSK